VSFRSEVIMIFRRILMKLSRRRRLQQDLESELAFHRDLAREHGNPIALGNITRIQEEARDIWRFTLVEDLWRDLLYALRSLRRASGFASIAILTIALGIGANTAIFSLIHRVMLAPLPVREPGQLIEVLTNRDGVPAISFSYQALQDFRDCTQVCAGVIGFSNVTFHGVIEGAPMQRLSGQFVTGDYFSGLGVEPIRGRSIAPENDRTGTGDAVAVISYSMWRDRFGSDPEVLGKTVVLENVPFTVIGVAPAGFHGLEVGRQNDVWVPLEAERNIRRPSYTSSAGYKWIQLAARIKPGKTVEEAYAELRVLFHRAYENEIAELSGNPQFDASVADRIRSWSLLLEPAGTGFSRTRQEYSRPLFVLMAIVGVLLLIACTNVANLLFARALARQKEIALRLSLGAGRARLVRQLLTESAVLVAAGGALGVLMAHFLTSYLAGFLATSNAPILLDVSPNLATLGFTAGIAVFTVIFFGLMPAFRSTDMDFAAALKGAGTGGRAIGNRWSRGLIIVQVALLMVLIVGAGLFLRTLHNLNSIDLGFDRSNVLMVVVDPFGSDWSPEQLRSFSLELLDRLEALPGVRTATLTRYAPISGGSGSNRDFVINDDGGGSMTARSAWVNFVGAKYFETLNIPVIAGREFDRQASTPAQQAVIVNQAFARRYFGNTPPIGKTVTQRGTALEIVGVVSDAKYSDIREVNAPTVYYDLLQNWGVPMQFLIRTERDPQTIAPAVRAEVRSAIGNVVIRERTLEGHIDASIVRERMLTSLAALFGGLALVLAVIGLYGVVSNSVASRTKEIGIRMALGFDQRRAVSMVLREIFVLVGAGIVIGLPLAMLVTRSIAGLLYGLKPDDPLTVIASVAALLLSALAAAFVPARRASRIDPIIALRLD
jgi:predicted permease